MQEEEISDGGGAQYCRHGTQYTREKARYDERNILIRVRHGSRPDVACHSANKAPPDRGGIAKNLCERDNEEGTKGYSRYSRRDLYFSISELWQKLFVRDRTHGVGHLNESFMV